MTQQLGTSTSNIHNSSDTTEELFHWADRLIADSLPGEEIEVLMSRSTSNSIRVHGGEVESVTAADSSGAGIRVISNGRLGFAHCGSLDPEVLRETLIEARNNCEFAEPDPANGLAMPDGVPVTPQDKWSDAVLALSADEKIEMALDLERRVTSRDPRVVGARTTAYGDGWGESVLVSTQGIRVSDRGSSCSIATQPLVQTDDETQIGFAVEGGRDPERLDLDEVAREAVERATRLLGAVKPKSGQLTIVLEPRLAVTLLGIVSSMLTGSAVVKGRSAFANRLGEQIASPLLTLTDDPTVSESLGAEAVDGEGLACRPNLLIENGVLDRFLYDTYSANKAGTKSTASAVRGTRSLPGVGAQVLVIEPGTKSLDELRGQVDHGLFVNSFSGLHSGVNAVSGDFSVGSDGLMIRDGELAEPVKEITIASTIQRLLLDISAVGSDFEWLNSGHGGCSLVIDGVSVSGV